MAKDAIITNIAECGAIMPALQVATTVSGPGCLRMNVSMWERWTGSAIRLLKVILFRFICAVSSSTCGSDEKNPLSLAARDEARFLSFSIRTSSDDISHLEAKYSGAIWQFL